METWRKNLAGALFVGVIGFGGWGILLWPNCYPEVRDAAFGCSSFLIKAQRDRASWLLGGAALCFFSLFFLLPDRKDSEPKKT